MISPIRGMKWDQGGTDQGEATNLTWEIIETKFRHLCGSSCQYFSLSAANGNELLIGGDIRIGYVVSILKDKKYYTALAPTDCRKGTVEIVIGFQPADYPRRIVVAFDVAFRVARCFYETGRAFEGVEWTLDHQAVE